MTSPRNYQKQKPKVSQQTNEIVSENKVSKVLILTQARSGSSFLGSVMSSDKNAFFVFEPFQRLKSLKIPLEEDNHTHDPQDILVLQNYLSNIFNCDLPKKQLGKRKQRNGKNLFQCAKTNLRIIKTIRMRREHIESWILRSNVKIVHLVRDPRGILNSRESRPNIAKDAKILCDNMEEDLRLEKTLPSSKYIRVKYEDLVDQPSKTVFSIFNHLNLPYTKEVQESLYRHTHAQPGEGNHPFSVNRPSTFTHDSWRKSLSSSRIAYICEKCKNIMKRLEYK